MDALVPGDVVRLDAGERVPADAVITQAALDTVALAPVAIVATALTAGLSWLAAELVARLSRRAA